MRKFFALALAVAMVLSLASVSFAADTINTVANVALVGPYRYDADNDIMIAPGEKYDVIRYGAGAYYLIKVADAKDQTTLDAVAVEDYKATGIFNEIEKLKVKAEFEMGEDLVESVSIVKKYVEAGQNWKQSTDTTTSTGVFSIDAELPEDASGDPISGYYYFVEFKVASKQTTADADIIGTLEFNRKADDEVKGVNYVATTSVGIGKIDDAKVDFEMNVFYKDTFLNTENNANLEITKDTDLEYDTNYALKFKNDEEVELTFGKGEMNEGSFTVDVSGQGKIFFNYNTKADEAICAANPGAKLFFLNFNNAKFNRVGTFEYEMDGLAAAYKVVDGKLVEINGLELDTDTATFNTRVLESYVFADAELVNPVVEAPVVEAPAAVTNPSTGF